MIDALNQFLTTATGGNVKAEFAVATNRWRLKCKKCEQTLTFSEAYDLEKEYREKGRLDAGVQQFAKSHQHQIKLNVHRIKHAQLVAAMLKAQKERIESLGIKEVKEAPIPRKTEGRKFR